MELQRDRWLLRTAALVGIAVLGMAFSGCGTSRDNLLAPDTAAEFNRDIDRINELVAEGDCLEALQLAEEVRVRVENLGEDADPKLRRYLLDGVTRLAVAVQRDCEPADTVGEAGGSPEPAPVEEPVPTSPDPGQANDSGGGRPDEQQGGSGGDNPDTGGVTPGGSVSPEQPAPPTGGDTGD